MRYVTARNFRTAIEARLKSHVTNDDPKALVQIRKQIAFDRFLARLLAVSPDDWLLKGGTALQYRLGKASRYTKDLDLVLRSDAASASDAMQQAVAWEVSDFFSFSLRQSRRLDHGAEGASLRFTLRCELDGRLFENIIVDVGFDQPSSLPLETIAGTDFLDFADIPAIIAPILPIEVHLAEKLHAFAKVYEGNRQSTRVKDLIDIVLIGKSFALHASKAQAALDHTFGSRSTQSIPPRLGPAPAGWTAPYAGLAESVGLDPDIAVGHAYAASLLDPLLGGVLPESAVWNHAVGEWRVE